MIALATALMIAVQAHALPLAAEDRAPNTPSAQAQQASTAGAATQAEEERAGRPLVCRDEPVIGSRFPVRRCRPANLTPQERALAADQLRRQQTVAMKGH